MKVEHHVTIHSGMNIHAPVFAESMEEAERLGREWALAQFAASGYDPEWLQLQAEVVTPRPEQLIRAVYASPGNPAEVVLLCGDWGSLRQLFGGQIDVALRLGDLALLTQKPPADAFFDPPDRMLELTDLHFLHLFGPQVFCTMRDGKLASVPKELEDFLVEQLEMAAMRADC